MKRAASVVALVLIGSLLVASDVRGGAGGLVVPTKTTGSFTTNPVALTAGGTGSSTLTVSTQRNGPVGPFTLTITATGGGKTHTQTVTLNLSR